MQATMRKIGALLVKDAMDLFKNPTILICVLLPIAMVLLYTRLMGGSVGDDPELSSMLAPFYLSCALCFSAAMAGSMSIVYAIAEEREKHTLRTLMLANVSAGQVMASRAVLAVAVVVVVDAACFFVVEGEKGSLATYLAIGVLGSLPLLVLSLLAGLGARDQMTAGVVSMPILLVAIAPIFSMYSEDVANVVQWLPTGGMDALVRLSVAGDLLTGEAVQPLLITLGWLAVSVAAFALLFRRLARDN